MSEVTHYPGHQETSPRSTILVTASTAMTSSIPVLISDTNLPSDEVLSTQGKISHVQKIDSKSGNVSSKLTSDTKGIDSSELNAAKSFDHEAPPTPISHDYSTCLHYPNQTHTPQPLSGYYVYPPQPHMIPDPESPGGNRLIGTYDVGSFFQPHSGAAFHPPSASPNAFLRVGRSSKPLTPSRGSSTASAGAPTSPLFTRGTRNDGMTVIHQSAPVLPYMASPQLSASNVYPMYPSTGITSNSSDDSTWNGQNIDSRNQNAYQMHYGLQVNRATSGGRSYSIDETTMLSPSTLDDQVNPAYSPYNTGGPSSTTGFAPQVSWGYPPDPYGSPTSPLQPRPTVQIGMPGVGMRQGPAYSPNYTINCPGQPIQTTPLNKGPDGANLFIFHIPNHYTNLDMFHLFMPYGNLLSVRIMVERETGRSRGFGFVSYDSAESAALAIKELNGYPIGNKRLKVQHKQIRRNDLQDDDLQDSFGSSANFQRDPTLPPTGPSQTQWYESGNIDEDEEGAPGNNVDVIGGVELEREDRGTSHPSSIEVSPNDSEESPLATLGQLENSLPDIPGRGEDLQE